MTSVLVAISTVADGSMLNRHDGNDQNVIKNRKVFLNKYGIDSDDTTCLNIQMQRRLKYENDTNFCRYIAIDKSFKGMGMKDDKGTIADAFITTELNHALALPVADCIGAVLYSPSKQVLMLSHLGRHSLEQQGAEKSVRYLVETYKADAANIQVWLTPAASKEKFPIWALENKGMKEAALEQLVKAGIQEKNITDYSENTDEDETYYSYSEFLKGNRNEDGDHMIVAVMH